MKTNKLFKLSLSIFILTVISNQLNAQINNGVNVLSNNSSSTGNGNTGSGSYSFSAGNNNTTTGTRSIALGQGNMATNSYSIASGYGSEANGGYSMASGYYAKALGTFSYSYGRYVTASQANSFVIGNGFNASNYLVNNISNSLMIGFNSNIPTLFISASTGIGTSGKVGIGTTNVNCGTNCDGYRLFVTDGIKTEKIKVEVASIAGWADYVFEPDYKLQKLYEVENFIKENKHLPNVPSAKEVTENGIDLAKMDATLLRKIEELTLYMIEQQNQIKKLQEQLNQGIK